jgi:uncharacterized glyoxalase superfamily protein PhnB
MKVSGREGGSLTTDQVASVVIPMLSYEDPARAADWVAEAFGFRETGRWADADGRVTHVNMELRLLRCGDR